MLWATIHKMILLNSDLQCLLLNLPVIVTARKRIHGIRCFLCFELKHILMHRLYEGGTYLCF